MVQKVYTSDPALQLEGATQIRKLLSIERNPPINEVIASGVIPRLVQFLGEMGHSKLQFEAAWALTNIASGNTDQTKAVVDANAIPVFVRLLCSGDNDVKEQSIWALGNIAGESTELRDYVLANGAMHGLVQGLSATAPSSLVKNATWTISNFCRGKPEPPFEYVRVALPALKYLICNSRDDDVLTDACWALSYLSDGENDKVQSVLDTGVTTRLVELLMHTSFSVKTPALRTLGNMVTGDDHQTQAVLECNILTPLLALLNSSKKGIKKEACWAISNITAGSKVQIQAVVDGDIIPTLVRLLGDAEYDVKKEAAWAVTNATSGGSRQQIAFLVNKGCIKPLCDLLALSDPRIISVALDALENIMKSEQRDSNKLGAQTYADLVEEAEGIDKLELLQEHQNVDIYNKAVHILETYFAAEAEDENVSPNVVTSSTGQQSFTFGFSAPVAMNAPTGGFNFVF